MPLVASVNGSIGPAETATVSVLDNGFTFGDSVYETLRTYAGRPFHLRRHLARIRASAARLGFGIPTSDDDLARELDELLRRAGNPESYIRLIVSRGLGDISYRFERVKGPTIVMVVKPYEATPETCFEEGVKVVITSVRRNHRQALDPAIKSCNLLNNVLATREAQSKGGHEAILLNLDGDVAEGAGSNVFAVRGGALTTPPLETGILEGITREVVLALARSEGIVAHEARLTPAELLGADEAFITSTLKEVLPIREIDDTRIGKGKPGPVTRRLLAAFRAAAPSYCN